MPIVTHYNQDYYYRVRRRGRRVISTYVGNMRDPAVLAEYEKDQRRKRRIAILREQPRCMKAALHAADKGEFELAYAMLNQCQLLQAEISQLWATELVSNE